MARLALLLSALLLALLPLALAEERRLIKIAEEEPATWLTEEEALLLVRVGVNFFDITDTPELEKGAAPRASLAFPAKPSHQSVVNGLLGQIVHERFVADLTYFSQQHLTRYYKSPSGVQSANWLFQQAQEIASNRSDITVSQVSHAGYDQRSVVARIRGRNPTGPAVILGAHQDSINSRDPMGRSPGADDDGSGSMSVLEVFRTLALSGFVPELPIEFHWYAAEEVGLLGSQAIASSYKNKGEPVYAMFNLDMTAYTEPGLAVRVIMDFTNRDLSLFTATVVDEYTSLSWRTHNCGYACSDHASWNRAGYNSASIFEPKTNPRIHTNEDDLPLVNWEQTNQFLRLGLAIVVELSYGA